MRNRLAIVHHHSDIIREGLYSVIQRETSARVILMEDLKGINDLICNPSDELIFITPYTQQVISLLEQYRRNISNRSLFIGITTQEYPSRSDRSLFAHIHNVENETCSDLLALISEFYSEEEIRQDDELSAREREVLKAVALGHTNKSIADLLHISMHTVISHRKNITEKLGVKSIPGLTVYALINGIVLESEISQLTFYVK